MAVSIDELHEIKDKLDKLTKKKASLEGQLQSELKRLEEEFGVKNLTEARKKLKELKAKLEEMEEEVETAYQKFVKKYQHLLEIEKLC